MKGENSVKVTEVEVRGLKFRCRTAGLSNKGEGIIFLHGFPETSFMWNDLLESFASKGYRCVAPDQRGYSEGARPSGKRNYSYKEIATDVEAFADYFDFGRFHLVGHDWGAGCGWAYVELFGERLLSYSALSVPHMKAFNWAKTNDPEQMERSWYINFFQMPVLPELTLGKNNFEKLRKLWALWPLDQIDDYMRVFRTYSGRKCTINWYRANKYNHKNPNSFAFHDVTVPTILIWGKNDFAIRGAGVKKAAEYMKGEYKLIELDAGHWLIQEKFDDVEKALYDHIKKHSEKKGSAKAAKKAAKKSTKKASKK